MNKIRNRTPWPRWARVVSFTLLAAVVWFIFSHSMQVAEVSNQTSVSILDRLLAKLPFLQGWFTNFILRKLGHFVEYGAVGAVLFLCLRSCTVHLLAHLSPAVLSGVLIALTDETIQLFVEGRSGQVSDVWLDSAGMCCGLLAGWVILRIVEECTARRRSKTGGAE